MFKCDLFLKVRIIEKELLKPLPSSVGERKVV